MEPTTDLHLIIHSERQIPALALLFLKTQESITDMRYAILFHDFSFV